MKDKLFKEYQKILKKWDKYKTKEITNFKQLYDYLLKENDYEINYYIYNEDEDVLLDMVNMSMDLTKCWYDILNEQKGNDLSQEQKRFLINKAILKYIYDHFGDNGI